jgi:hypothetical protein
MAGYLAGSLAASFERAAYYWLRRLIQPNAGLLINRSRRARPQPPRPLYAIEVRQLSTAVDVIELPTSQRSRNHDGIRTLDVLRGVTDGGLVVVLPPPLLLGLYLRSAFCGKVK